MPQQAQAALQHLTAQGPDGSAQQVRQAEFGKLARWQRAKAQRQAHTTLECRPLVVEPLVDRLAADTPNAVELAADKRVAEEPAVGVAVGKPAVGKLDPQAAEPPEADKPVQVGPQVPDKVLESKSGTTGRGR